MDLTTYGYKRPENPDTGKTFFAALDFNIDRVDAHSHNGVDSTLLPTNSTAVTTQLITPGVANANWGADLGGLTYKQTITLPSVGTTPTQLTFDAIGIEIRDTATGERIYPRLLKSAASNYDIYTNDPASAWTAIYTS